MEPKSDEPPPEGPECKIISTQLNQKITGKKLLEIQVVSGRYIRNSIKDMLLFTESIIESVSCHGKFIYMKCGTYHIHNTLGMTGTWTQNTNSIHNRIRFLFSDGSEIFFNDQRNFGTISIVNPEETNHKISGMGIDLLAIENREAAIIFGTKKLDSIKNKNYNITRVLMDQSILAGVGNYIKCEAMYRSSVNPYRAIGDLTEKERRTLIDHLWTIMHKSYQAGGATIRNYTDTDEKRGLMSFAFKVYGKKLDPNGNVVLKEETPDGRRTHWCPRVQV